MGRPEELLESFLAKYSPEIAARGRQIISALRRRLPTAVRIVYDNYNALAVGFGPDERAGHVILSVVLYPRWVSLFFMQAQGLHDPEAVLRGQGKVARHVVMAAAEDLDQPALVGLIDQAVAKASIPLRADGEGYLVIKSVSAKQRPRRP